MFRDDLAAAHARIDSLENELRLARESATEEAGERIAKLEAELARARRTLARSPVFSGTMFVMFSVIIGTTIVYSLFFAGGGGGGSLEHECSGGDGHACVGWGIGLERTNVAASEKAYKRGCELGDAQGCYNQGVLAYRERKDRTAAVVAFRKACGLDYANACANLSALLEDKTEKLAVARKACDLGVALGCTNAASRHVTDGEYDAGIKYGQKACDGGSVGGCQNLAEAFARKGDAAKALAAATRSVHINEQHPSAHATLGSVLVINGELDQAIVHYRRALELEHHPGGDERPVLDEPIAMSIKKDLGVLRGVYPKSAAAIDDALKRLAELLRK